MYRKEVNAQSPIRILEKSIHGGLGRGNLGVVMARAGVGKTACLVQIGLDDLMRERPVLHVSLEHSVEHVQSWYDALFDDLAIQNDLDNEDEVRAMVVKRRVIQSFADHDLWPERLEKTVEMFKNHLDFKPAAILVDGYDWSAHTVAENAAMIGAFKSYAKLLESELWMTAQTHRRGTGEHPTLIPPPCNECESLIDVAIFLEPHGEDVGVRLLKDHDEETVPDTHLHLHPDTLRMFSDDDGQHEAPTMPPTAYTLLSGGASGAEECFGEIAQEFGLMELNFTFEGRTPKRTRGLVRLTQEELEQGAVSAIYVEAHMHRKYPSTEIFRKTLQSIWHHVSTAREVFAVGWIQDDKTVKGGTGWAVELARVWHKPIFVFDQAKKAWFYWDDHDWAPTDAPKITERRFAGAGTRDLDEGGRTAIRELFARSFEKSA